MINRIVLALAVGVTSIFLPSEVWAQGTMGAAQTLASQSLRGYTHMFIAYAIAWILIFGWVISIARRLARVEKALKE